MTEPRVSEPVSLGRIVPYYRALFRGYLGLVLVALMFYAVTSNETPTGRISVMAAAVIGAVFMFWGGYAVLGAQIQLHPRSPFVRSLGLFGFCICAVNTGLMLLAAARGDRMWLFWLLPAAAAALGILRAWARLAPARPTSAVSL